MISKILTNKSMHKWQCKIFQYPPPTKANSIELKEPTKISACGIC